MTDTHWSYWLKHQYFPLSYDTKTNTIIKRVVKKLQPYFSIWTCTDTLVTCVSFFSADHVVFYPTRSLWTKNIEHIRRLGSDFRIAIYDQNIGLGAGFDSRLNNNARPECALTMSRRTHEHCVYFSHSLKHHLDWSHSMPSCLILIYSSI